MSQITAIEPQKKRQERWSVFVDGEFAVGVSSDTLLTLGLYVGKTIDQRELDAAIFGEDKKRALNSAINLLSYRQRTKTEISQHLRKKDYTDDVIGPVLEELDRVGLVDDAQFSKDWVDSRTKLKPKSRNALVAELRGKGVDKELAEKAVEEIDSEDEHKMARDVAENAARKTSKQGDARVGYLSGVLQRRGFSWEIIRRVLEELESES